jgi:citronellol/citronellal dehydrogenase
MATLQGQTIFITGASRGIGRSIALRCARDGARIVIVAKTVELNPKLAATIYTVAEEVRQAGVRRCRCRSTSATRRRSSVR